MITMTPPAIDDSCPDLLVETICGCCKFMCCLAGLHELLSTKLQQLETDEVPVVVSQRLSLADLSLSMAVDRLIWIYSSLSIADQSRTSSYDLKS